MVITNRKNQVVISVFDFEMFNIKRSLAFVSLKRKRSIKDGYVTIAIIPGGTVGFIFLRYFLFC